MPLHLTPKHGIPALAYTASDHRTPWSCTLSVRHCEDPMQTTFSLMGSIPIHGYDEEQTFILIYDADNLVSGKTTLEPATIPLPQDLLNEITPQGNPLVKTLSFTLIKTCPVWGPTSGSIAPKSDLDPSFHQLVQLASPLEIHILFDYNLIHPDQRARFERLTTHAKVLTGLLVKPNFGKRYRLVDWSLFNSVKDAVSEAPPSYFAVHKRSGTFETPEPPPSKRRAPSSPQIEAPSSPQIEAPSSPQIEAPSSPQIEASSPTEQGTPPPSPPAYAPAYEKATLVATILPVLQSILPELIGPLLAPSFSTPSPTNTNTKNSSYLSNLLDARLAACVKVHQSKISAEMLDHAEQINKAARIDLEEELDDHERNIRSLKEDGIMLLNDALNNEIDDKLQDFKAITQEMVDGLDECVEKVFIKTREELDDLVGEKLAFLQQERKKLTQERHEFEAEKQRYLGQKSSSKRAMSVPL